MKKYIYIILINIIILCILIKIVDLFIFNSLEVSYISDNYKLNIRTYKKNLDVIYKDPVQNKNINLLTDSDGYISANSNDKNSTKDIYFIGGSTTANIGVETNFRFPFIFGENIASYNFNVYNAGVGGNHSYHSNIILLSKILKNEKRPKYIFLHHNVNDISQLIRTQSYWIDYNNRGILQIKDKDRFSNPFINLLFKIKEFLFPNLYSKLSPILKRSKSKINNSIDKNIDSIDTELVKNEFQKSIMLFIEICKTYDIIPVLLTQYSRYNIYDNEIRKVHSNNIKRYELICKLHPEFNEILRKVAVEKNIHLIDLAQVIPGKKDYIYDEVHLNRKGNELVAQTITNYFLENLFKPFNNGSN